MSATRLLHERIVDARVVLAPTVRRRADLGLDVAESAVLLKADPERLGVSPPAVPDERLRLLLREELVEQDHRRVHRDALRLQLRKLAHHALKRRVHHAGRQCGRVVRRCRAARGVLPLAKVELGAAVVAVDEHEARVGLALPTARPCQTLGRV